MKKSSFKPGFTLIEITISIVIVGILAAITMVSYSSFKERALAQTVKSDLINAAVVLASDLSTNGKFPDTLAAANSGNGVKTSDGIVFNYTYDASRNAYLLVATYASGKVYYITSTNKTPTPGPAPTSSSLVFTWGAGGADSANRVVKTFDSGFAVTGSVTDKVANRTDMFINKYRYNGSLEWTKSWDGPWGSEGKSVVQTPDNGFEVFGDTDSYNYIAKYAANGVLGDWAVMAQDEEYDYFDAAGIAMQNDYTFITTANSGSPFRDGYIVGQIEIDGTPDWSSQYGDVGHGNYAADVAINNDGGYTVVGSAYNSISSSRDATIVKYDSNNNTMWDLAVSGPNIETASSVVQTSDGGYMMVGTTNSSGAGGDDAFIAKISSGGLVSWTRTWGGTGTDSGKSIIQTSDSGYAIAGSTNSFGNNSAFIAKFNSSGTLLWDQTWGGTGTSVGNSVAQINNNSYVLAGSTDGYGSGSTDVLIAMYAPDGTINGCPTTMCKDPAATVGSTTMPSLAESYIIYDSTGLFTSHGSLAYIERVIPSLATKTLVAPW